MFAPDPTADGPPSLHLEGPLACLRLNRPRQRNRLDDGDLAAAIDALDALGRRVRDPATAADAPRVLVLASGGPAFCAGYDLRCLAADPVGGPQRFEALVQALIDQPLPVVARVQGGVYGGATDLALACDFRIGGPRVELRMPAARIGLHFSPRGLARFTARLGPATARRLFLTAPTLDADALLRIGYLDERVDGAGDEALDAAVLRWAATLARGAPLAVQGMRQSLEEAERGAWGLAAQPQRGPQGDRSAWVAALDREARCAASADLREGLAALAEGRDPVFAAR